MNYIDNLYEGLIDDLIKSPTIQVGEWQSMDTRGSKAHSTHELMNITLKFQVPMDSDKWATDTKADLPWAEDHFLERVSGIPHNPPPSHVNWPYGYTNRHQTQPEGKFDHTYPERFWPRYRTDTVTVPQGVGDFDVPTDPTERDALFNRLRTAGGAHPERQGIRFRYGDLQDVVDLLIKRPLTRQAFLPVWFPEDTGAHDGQRVPCTIGYHFIIRDAKLHCVYYIRSCDIYRHLRNDVYLAGRLMKWMADKICSTYGPANPDGETGDVVIPGELTMHITSLHLFVGDVWKVRDEKNS